MNQTPDKYIMATIQIPMKIQSDGNYESMVDYLSIEFNLCENLPKKINKETYIAKFKTMISTIFESMPLEELPLEELPLESNAVIISVNPNEIMPHIRGHNMSFKNRNRNRKNYSMKIH